MDDLINCSYIVVQPSNDSRDFGPWLLFSYDKTIQSSNRRDGQGPLETKHQSTIPVLRRTHRWDTILDLVTHCITDTVALMPTTKVVVLTPSSYHNIKQKPLDLPQKRRKWRPQGEART